MPTTAFAPFNAMPYSHCVAAMLDAPVVGTVGFTAPILSGGTVTISGGYVYHTFTSSGVLYVYQAGVVDYLLIGGGGGGGYGGGGAGQFVPVAGYTVAVGSYPITIGAGGNGTASAGGAGQGADGGTSTFGSISTAIGGGGGGAYSSVGTTYNGRNGASGGGAGARDVSPWAAGTAGTGTAGFNGGVGSATGASFSGAGGGSSAAGSGKVGGNGTAWLDGVTRAGGGGGAGGGGAGQGGAGGSGGGGAGGDGQGGNATANTGSGGGGTSVGATGGNGAAGVFILRYAVTDLLAGLYATGGTITVDGNLIRHTITASGNFALAMKGLLALTDGLAVGGGGAGGSNMAGGGGGGQVLPFSATNITANVTVTIGAGGVGSANANGTAGGTTSFGSIASATGGGYGGRGSGPGSNGGTGVNGGGGGGDNGGSPGTGGVGSAFNGGNGSGGGGTVWAGGGGAGAGAIGTNAAVGVAGNGGNGVTWNGATYGGGGGGAPHGSTSGTAGTGGTGGGGAGTVGVNSTGGPGVAGTANTGGGGGAAGNNLAAGGNGGSGVVIVRYAPGSFQPGHPAGFGANLQSWWDPTTGVTATAGAVSQWNDQAAHANHYVQATGANQPLNNSATTPNGLAAIDFDGSNDWMDGSNFDIDISGKKVCFFGVIKWDAAGTGKCVIQNMRSGGTLGLTVFMLEVNTVNPQMVIGDGGNAFSGPAFNERLFVPPGGVTAWHRIIFTLDSTDTWHAYVDGTEIATSNGPNGGSCTPANFLSSNSTPWKPTVGRRADPFYFDGKVAHHGYLNVVPNSTDRTLLDNWLKAKTGV